MTLEISEYPISSNLKIGYGRPSMAMVAMGQKQTYHTLLNPQFLRLYKKNKHENLRTLGWPSHPPHSYTSLVGFGPTFSLMDSNSDLPGED